MFMLIRIPLLGVVHSDEESKRKEGFLILQVKTGEFVYWEDGWEIKKER